MFNVYVAEFGKGSTLRAMKKYLNCCDGCQCAICEDRTDDSQCGNCLNCDFGSKRAYVDMCDKMEDDLDA